MEKIKIIIDFEVRSNVDISACGKVPYAHGKDTKVLMMAYKEQKRDGTWGTTYLWEPSMTWIPPVAERPEEYIIYAHNAQFEHAIWNIVCVRDHRFKPTDIRNFVDTMALCGRYGIPQSLEKAAEVLGARVKKNPDGKALINLFCTPKEDFGVYHPHREELYTRFKQYCKDDVDATLAVLEKLPSDNLSKREQEVYYMSCGINSFGIPIDIPAVKMIRRVAEEFREGQFSLLPSMTDGKITKITQVKRLKEFLNDMGVDIPSCSADMVQKYLGRDDLPDLARALLEMRSDLGASSVGKYIRFENMSYNGRVGDSQVYYGAHTGRWTGSGVQLLNLPRASVKDPEDEIAKFFDGRIANEGENAVASARALIRPMIKAPEGKAIAAADYSSIEYVVAEWFADNTEALIDFSQGLDQYKSEASKMYGIPYDQVDKAQRQAGKIVILGCGYGQGWETLISTAETTWGMKLTPETAKFMVDGYRKNHSKLVRMWYACKDAAVKAIQNPGTKFPTHKCIFQVVRDRAGVDWLRLELPSGRPLFYRQPFLEATDRGIAPSHMGFHRTSKQWLSMRLIPGRIVENIVQAAARDILVNGMFTIEKEMGKIICMTVYDEVVCEIDADNQQEQLDQICKCLCTPEEWSKDIPLEAEGFTGPRYKKM